MPFPRLSRDIRGYLQMPRLSGCARRATHGAREPHDAGPWRCLLSGNHDVSAVSGVTVAAARYQSITCRNGWRAIRLPREPLNKFGGLRCGRRGAECEAPRRRRCGTSVRSDNEAGGASPPATRWAGAGCSRSAALLVVNDATASPPPRALHLGRKRHQRYVAYF
jgi:hypothetical protein